MEEKRQHERKAVNVNLTFRSGDNFYMGRTKDLSLGGLFFETNEDLDIGTELNVELKLLKKSLVLRTEVVWALTGDDGRTQGVGVRFLELPPETKKTIQTFVALRKPMDFDVDLPEEVED